jgi:hypothetical protein
VSRQSFSWANSLSKLPAAPTHCYYRHSDKNRQRALKIQLLSFNKLNLFHLLLDDGLLVMSRSQQKIKEIDPSTSLMMCVVLISVFFCSCVIDG